MSSSSHINWKRTEFFIEAELRVPVLDRHVEVWVQPESDSASSPSAAQVRAFEAFLTLTPEQKADWTHQVALDCHYTCLQFQMDGYDPPVRLRKRGDVWKYVRLRNVFIPQHGPTLDRYVFVHGNCGWDKEHGLELLFKNERLFSVGQEVGLAQNEAWSRCFIDE